MQKYSEEQFVNVGTGVDVTIKELAELVGKVTGFQGKIRWDTTQPDGTPRKLLEISRLRDLGWSPQVALADGLSLTYEAFLRGEVAHRAAA
jgi:GDP-L-fucose synthase